MTLESTIGAPTVLIALVGIIFSAGAYVMMIKFITAQMDVVKGDIRELRNLLTTAAVLTQGQVHLEERQNNFDKRMNLIAERVDELRHGRGFVQRDNRNSVEGEYGS